MIWKTSRDSTLLPTKDGSLAVRVDGDPHKDPLLLCQRFRGTMDDWDPEFVARLSTARRVIRFDSLGIGESSGETPDTVRGILQGGPDKRQWAHQKRDTKKWARRPGAGMALL